MRVMVYKQTDGKRTVLLMPSIKSGKRPVVVKGLDREGLKAGVAQALADVALQPGAN